MKRAYKLFWAIVAVSSLARVALVNVNKALAWDEIIYLSMAKSLSQGLSYGWVSTFSDAYRAPGITYLIYAFNFVLNNAELAGRVGVVLISVASIFLAYLVGTDWFNQRVGILAALVVSTNAFHVFFSHRVLSENVFGFLILLSVYMFWKVLYKNKFALLAIGPVLALSSMVRYETVIVAFVLLVYAVLFRRKELAELIKTKEFFASVILFLVILGPWFRFSQEHFGSPFGAAVHHVTGTISGFVNPIVLPLMYPLAFGLLLPFLFYALYRTFEYHGEKPLFMFFFLLVTLFLIGLKNNVLRYSIPFIPIGAVFVSAAAFHLKKNWKAVFVLLCIGNLLVGYGTVYLFNQTEIEDSPIYGVLQGKDDSFREHLDMKEAGLKLKELTSEDEVVMTDAYAFVHYWSQRPYIEVPPEEELDAAIEEHNISYIYSTQHISYLEKFKPVFANDNAIIYKT